MPNENEILPLQSDFEQIKRTDADGRIFWSARELSSAMGYSTYQKFCRILDKSMASAQAKGLNLADHFNRVVEMVKLGSGAFREVENVHLSREACLLVVENADRKKPFQPSQAPIFQAFCCTRRPKGNLASRLFSTATRSGCLKSVWRNCMGLM